MQPLTQDEANLLPDFTQVEIQWAGSEEKFEYTIRRNKWGVVCVYFVSMSSIVTESNIKHRTPLKNVGTQTSKNKVFLLR